MDLETKSLHNAASPNTCFLFLPPVQQSIGVARKCCQRVSIASACKVGAKSTLVEPHASIRTE